MIFLLDSISLKSQHIMNRDEKIQDATGPRLGFSWHGVTTVRKVAVENFIILDDFPFAESPYVTVRYRFFKGAETGAHRSV